MNKIRVFGGCMKKKKGKKAKTMKGGNSLPHMCSNLLSGLTGVVQQCMKLEKKRNVTPNDVKRAVDMSKQGLHAFESHMADLMSLRGKQLSRPKRKAPKKGRKGKKRGGNVLKMNIFPYRGFYRDEDIVY